MLNAWEEFRKGKRSKEDVAQFEMNIETNLFELHSQLISGKWKPDPYTIFTVHDPKLRIIHKATVRDRVLYQAVYRKLYQIFDPSFIFHSYSSRNDKGTHAGITSFEQYIRKVSKNYNNSGYILKCDIKKFFDSIDHDILFSLIKRKISDLNLLLLIRDIIDFFSTFPGKGLPLGNVTSQLFANIYMNELDQHIKHQLKIKYYVRYCDDFGVVANSREYLEYCVREIRTFCETRLLLNLHPHKVVISKIHQGIDFLGYVLLRHYRVLRTRTKKRTLKKLKALKQVVNLGKTEEEFLERSAKSYLGMLTHCNGKKIAKQIEAIIATQGKTRVSY